MAVTIVPKPAFQECFIQIVEENNDSEEDTMQPDGVYVDNVRVAEDTLVAPVMTLASISPVGVAADISIGVIPKGSGGILAAVPDNTPAGGDARGIQAIDLQISRSLSTQVASGLLSSILGGANNTSAGVLSVVVGVLALPVLDSLRVYRRRAKNGFSPFRADRTHFHHLVLQLGLKNRYSTVFVLLVSLALIALSVVMG
jgi:hypothetical protein